VEGRGVLIRTAASIRLRLLVRIGNAVTAILLAVFAPCYESLHSAAMSSTKVYLDEGLAPELEERV
jgi:hypothetical protein